MSKYILLISCVLFVILILRMFRPLIIKGLVKLKNKAFYVTLRTAINDADKNKRKTNRKNMVVFNTDTNEFEAMQKRTLKYIANSTKNKSNRKQTDGARRVKKRKVRKLDIDRLKNIEKKSLYVTK